MEEDTIRIGQVSSINYESGMLRVVYEDRDDSVTDEFPCLNFNGEYRMPRVGQYVLVTHLSNGGEAGIVLGTYWNEANTPRTAGRGRYRKEMGLDSGDAYMDYNPDGTLTIKADKVVFETAAGNISLADIISKLGGA